MSFQVKALPVANPPNPWQSAYVEYLEAAPSAALQVYEDRARSIVVRNDSPDLGFRFSVNPYRGCFHGCAYCYARPSHEQLGFGSGTDFERKIVIKPNAPELLREAFDRESWQGELILFSGNTDCYQPLEASYRLTRRCLEVCAEYRNPAHVITKAPLVERDIDVLVELSRVASAGVSVSIPLFDEVVARAIEPYVATPARRFAAVHKLSAAGIDVTVNIAPMIPGLTDRDIPRLVAAAAEAGARSVCLIPLRLPGNVQAVFVERLERALPLRAEKVLSRTREMRGGKLNEPRFFARFDGEGEYIESVRQLFRAALKRHGLDAPRESAEPSPFLRPQPRRGQLRLFG